MNIVPFLDGIPLSEDLPQQRVRVWPANEDIRKYIKHPSRRIGFRGSVSESVEWPNDQFTKRRVADGTVLLNPPYEYIIPAKEEQDAS